MFEGLTTDLQFAKNYQNLYGWDIFALVGLFFLLDILEVYEMFNIILNIRPFCRENFICGSKMGQAFSIEINSEQTILSISFRNIWWRIPNRLTSEINCKKWNQIKVNKLNRELVEATIYELEFLWHLTYYS